MPIDMPTSLQIDRRQTVWVGGAQRSSGLSKVQLELATFDGNCLAPHYQAMTTASCREMFGSLAQQANQKHPDQQGRLFQVCWRG